MSRLKNLVSLIFILLIACLIAFSAGWFLSQRAIAEEQKETVTIKLDDLAVLKRVQSLNKLTTKEYLLERDLEIILNFEDLKVFDITILENRLVQQTRVSGRVFAGIDMSKLEQESVNVFPEEKRVEMKLPSAEILDVALEENRTDILNKDYSFLVGTKILFNEEVRTEVENTLQKQAIEEGKKGLTEAACQENILPKASEGAKENLQNFLLGLGFETVEIETTVAENCILS